MKAGASQQSGSAKKPERIEKELMLLRNLPHSYKLGRKTTSLGIVIYVSLHLFCFLVVWKAWLTDWRWEHFLTFILALA